MRRRRQLLRGPRWLLPLVALGLLLVPSGAAAEEWDDAAIEEFLRTAPVVARERVPKGVTKPQRLTLEQGGRRLTAVWKTVDEYRSSVRFADGRTVFGFYDRFQHEVVAYEIDRRIGLGMVPPTVERCLDEECGSLQLWIEGAMTETERIEKNLSPADHDAWAEAMYKVRLFHNLIDDIDYNNTGNLLIGEKFEIYIIDSSRAFRVDRQLQSEHNLDRFSRALLQGLRSLDEEWAESRFEDRLSKAQIAGLLHRRDRILKRAEKLVGKQGETLVLYD